jgi:hypothetical protein
VRVNVLHGIAVNDSQPFVNPSLWLSNPLKETQPTESVGKEDIMSKRPFAFQLGPYKIQLLTLFFIHFTSKKDFHHYSILVTDTPKKDVRLLKTNVTHRVFPIAISRSN